MFKPLVNAGTVGASLISVGNPFKSHIIVRGKNEFMWCLLFECGIRNLLFRVTLR